MIHFGKSNSPAQMAQAMRDELVSAGFEELRSVEDVDEALADVNGSTLLVFNSVCGCAAGSARPGVVQSLAEGACPDHLYTVFAGQDREATLRAREYLPDMAPSSPSAALIVEGKLAWTLPRSDIEGHTPEQVAAKLRAAYAEHLPVRS